MDKETLISDITKLFEQLAQLNDDDCMDAINQVRQSLHEYSPMKDNPVDCVLWIKQDKVRPNEYNPNRVAPPEMALLERSVLENGFTQPVVVWQDSDGQLEIIDGFHRSLVSKSAAIYGRLQGRLPVTIINQDKTGHANRVAATVQHDRTKGSPNTELMQNLVSELVQSGMSDVWIMEQFGMDVDELLRLKQLTGLAALFKDAEFSRSWVTSDREEESLI